MPSEEKKISVVIATTISGTTRGIMIMPLTRPRPRKSRPRSSASAPAIAMAVDAIVAQIAMITLLIAVSRMSLFWAIWTNQRRLKPAQTVVKRPLLKA